MGKSSKNTKSFGEIVIGRGGSESLHTIDDTRLPNTTRFDRNLNFKYYVALVVSLTTFIVYLSSLQNDFIVGDDEQYIYNNPYIRSIDLTFLKWSFSSFYASNWHPLTWISHALDYAVWGLNPLGHHLTNNIIHAVNTFFVVLLIARLLEVGRKRVRASQNLTSYDPSSTVIAATTTGLIFGLHPIHVESVAWVAERKDLLCGLFFLLSIIMYVNYMGSWRLEGKGQKIDEKKWQRIFFTNKYYLLALGFFVLSLLSKPMAVSLPAVLLILDWYPLKRIQSLKSLWPTIIEKLPFIALSLILSILTIMAQKAGGAMELMDVVPLSTRLLVAAGSLVGYVWKMILPINLLPYYPYPLLEEIYAFKLFIPSVLIAGITAACIYSAKKHGLWFAIWSYYVITLLPVLGIIQVGGQSMADRYAYLPSIGPFLASGLLVEWCFRRLDTLKSHIRFAQAALVTAVIVTMATLSYATVKQTGIWKNSIELWGSVIEKEDPRKLSMAYNNRGIAFLNKRQYERAVDDFTQAISSKPSFFEAHANRAFAFDEMGQFDKAIEDYNNVIALNPTISQIYIKLGILYGKTGALDKAIETFGKSLEINPTSSIAHDKRGYAYFLSGENGKALEDYNKAIGLNQSNAIAYLNRGNLYQKTGIKALALADFQKACELGISEGCNALKAVRQ